MTKVLLSQLDSDLGQVVEKIWPELKLAARFAPLLDLDLGDVGSDIAIRLAESLRIKPDEIAARICAAWTLPAHVNCSVLNGYINVRFEGAGLETFDEDPLVIPPSELTIVAAPFSKTPSRLAELRICSSVLCQLLIAEQLGIPAKLLLGGKTLTLQGGALALYRGTIDSLALRSGGSQADDFSSAAVLEACRSSTGVCLWIAPNALTRDTFVEFCKSVEQRGQQLWVQGPSAPWLDFRFHTETLPEFADWPDDRLLALLWYLAGQTAAMDIDFSIPRIAERSNIAWFWESTCERAARLVQRPSDRGCESGSPAELSPLMRRLGLRAAYLRAFYLRAALQGEVQVFMEALADTLITFNRVFNDPGFRIRQSGGKLSEAEIKILAGAHRSLSDSIT
ncbi:MAG: hypothetical protein J0M12_08125, partial [Deltaproteobacteria bacterium]|nr:hypothetical protein [Deltaproteobacteria bacterium]